MKTLFIICSGLVIFLLGAGLGLRYGNERGLSPMPVRADLP
jgi:hypothetical protein